MTDEIDEIRRQKFAELRERATPDSEDSSAQRSPSEPISVRGSAELTRTVSEHDVVLVDFYADWCGPCQMLEPVVETIASETGAAVAKVDIDANQQLATEYGVRGVPTLVLFSDGEPAERLVGMQDETQLRAAIEAHT